MTNKKEYHTKAKEKIISYFISQKSNTLSAKEIYDYLKVNGIPINLSTVYRNLEVLYKDGIVQKFQSSNRKTTVYQFIEKADNCHEHLHIQCIKCGKLLHLDCDYMNGLLDKFKDHLYANHKFTLELEPSMLYGICCSCGTKEQ